ncbi:hypothetical protein [Segniliparus rugosus]|uniref:Transmembrane protein n=1 Tax=Segniliparus rugosus (strain ATCC BAA-974 / DSM 45345 / CCUG 50838 / CIP 108380 / JCM 13579 / CDC 945) TaxID=679197 RepID=E5XPR4_SEGRC|nr:hypothetical protein [Segniliparus rugosus]EFV13662.1 hypothetical protein HMPREF9336_01486 [Segniliparus rugosus ATCC BAA-974]
MTLRKPRDKQWTSVAFNCTLIGSLSVAVVQGLVLAVVESDRMTVGILFSASLCSALSTTAILLLLIAVSTAGVARFMEEKADLAETRRVFIRAVVSIPQGCSILFCSFGVLVEFADLHRSSLLSLVPPILDWALYLALTVLAARASAAAYFDSAYPTGPEPPARERRVQSYFAEPPLPSSPFEPKEE